MNRRILCAILAILMLVFTACKPDDATAAHSCENVCEKCQKCLDAACAEAICAEKCQGHHACENVCGVCQKCFNTDCEQQVCAAKCEGHSESPFVFSDGDYITTTDTSIDTGTAMLDIGPGIYVRGDLAEKIETVLTTIETVSGLDFDGIGFEELIHKDGKIHIRANRDHLYVNQDWYQGSSYSEAGKASASLADHVNVSPGDLLIGHDYAVAHELSHVLMYRQAGWAHCQMLDEGFAEYTTYLTLLELEKSAPEYLTMLSVPSLCVNNMSMITEGMYEHPIEYWFEHTISSDYSLNTNYVIGFRFMSYLDHVYGDYTSWTLKFNEMYPYPNDWSLNVSPVEQQIAVLKATYGDGVLDGFYPWLKANESKFQRNNAPLMALEGVEAINWYPKFDAAGARVCMEPRFTYKDLYINIESARKYLSEYKSCDISDLKLKISDKIVVNLYRADGSYTTVRGGKTVSLDGISYIKLVGEGYLSKLEILGFTLPQS